MKIIYVITGLGVGGAEKQLSLLASHMLKRGHQVHIVSLTGSVDISLEDSIPVTSIGMKKSPLSIALCLLKVRKLVRTLKPDIVHSHMFHANLFSRILRIITSFPVLISTSHNSNEGGAIRMLAYNLTQKIPDLSTNVSQDAVDALIAKKAISSEKMIAVHNGIDTQKFAFSHCDRIRLRQSLSIDDDTEVILAVGRLVEAKDYPNLILSYRHLIHNNLLKKKVKLVIAGAGRLEQQLKSLAKSYNLSESILFLGSRDDIDRLFSIADVFVLASQWEGFGLVVAEAMSCERLVIGTDSGGVRDVIGQHGVLIPVKEPVILAEAIANLLALPDYERKKRGLASRKWIEQEFSIGSTVDKWIDIYQGLIEAKR